MTNEETPQGDARVQVDADWKAQAQAEKARLEEVEEKVAQKAEARAIPDADFRGLMGILASQAIMGLGTMQDPDTKGVIVDLEGSRFAIDLLAVLEEKTAGNLSEDEATEITQLVQELRSRFVQVAQLVAAQAPGGAMPRVESPASAADDAPAGGIIDPTA